MAQIIPASVAPYLYAILRIVVGIMFAMHGSQKLFGFPTGTPVPPASLMGLAGIIELVAGCLIAVGFLTGYAAFLASGQMAVAYFMQHAGQGGFWPIMNRGELAVVYCFLFLYMAARGSGPWSIDGQAKERRAF
jgi:putative oxidoreductase